MSAAYPEDVAAIVAERTWEHEGGRYGWRRYEPTDGRPGWTEYWGSRVETWGTRVFASLDEAARYVGTRTEPHDSFGSRRRR